MNKTTKQLIMTVAGTALSWTAVSANPAEAAKFNVTFSDYSGQQLGVGSFTYNDTGTICISLVPDIFDACSPESMFPVYIDVSHFLNDGYFFNIVGNSWFLAPSKTWWSDISQLPGQVLFDRNGDAQIFQNSWELGFGNSRLGSGGSLTMNFNSASNTSGSGSWNGETFDLDRPTSYFSGTWTATAVPEPLTLLGSLTALGLGASIKRKLARKVK